MGVELIGDDARELLIKYIEEQQESNVARNNISIFKKYGHSLRVVVIEKKRSNILCCFVLPLSTFLYEYEYENVHFESLERTISVRKL
jgi:hypothetical protein